MELKPNKRRMLAKYLISLFKMTLPKVQIIIHWIEGSELGYTHREKDKAEVFLNYGKGKELFEEMDESQQTLFITGVAVHEFMHQILTNFVLFEKMAKKKDKKERWLFKQCFNILEDSRIERYAINYFSSKLITALRYTIQQIWEASPETNPEDPVFNQVMNAVIQYGDIYLVKPELSKEAQEVFDAIMPIFNDAIDSCSCTTCLLDAQKMMEILLPYAPDPPEDEDEKASDSMTTLGKSDSEGEAAVELPKDSASTETGAEIEGYTAESPESGSENPDTGFGEAKGFDGDPEEVESDYEATAEDFEKAAKELEETLTAMEKSEKEKAAEDTSDYDFADIEKPTDKYAQTISHHKASAAPDLYETYRSRVASDSHELAKLIERQFRTKPGRKKRSDHGDLNLMRYKDPNFKSPLIFDAKKPKSKHSAAVMLLVDESGSMSGDRIKNARLATTMLAEAMAEAGVPCCVVGHSGDSKYRYSVELEHYTTFKNAKADRESIPMIAARCQNRDGPAIRWASSILRKRNERKKLLIVISDGAPCANDYGGQSAIFDTKSAIRDAKRCHDVIGIVLEAGYAVNILHTMYGDDFVECNQASQLKDCIASIIKKKCKEW